ncbi:MAG: glycosyltransferase [bacterium]
MYNNLTKDLPFVTVNILAHNRVREVDITLDKITNHLHYPSDMYEIIVVDNASTDGTYELIKQKYPKVKIIRLEKNVGIAGWNEGFKIGQGDYFLVLDDDAYIEGNTLTKLVNRVRKYSINLLSMKVINPYTMEEYTKSYPTGLLSFWGCAVLISKDTIKEAGYYDENIFVWAHELEYTIRILSRGLNHCYSPDIIAYHMKKNTHSDRQKLKISYRYNTKHIFYIAGKYFRGKYAYLVLSNLITTTIYTNLVYVLKGIITAVEMKENIREFLSFYDKGRKVKFKINENLQKTYLNSFIEFQNILTRKFYRHTFYNKNSIFYPESNPAIIRLRSNLLDVLEIKEIDT